MKLNKYINDKYKNYSRGDLIQEIERLTDCFPCSWSSQYTQRAPIVIYNSLLF